MATGIALSCPRCDRRYSPGERACCPAHNGERPTLELVYDESLREQYDPALATRSDIWRYRPFFPVEASSPVTLGEGCTDLVAADRLGADLGVELSLKLEGANPTGSAKDRGSAVVATHACEQGHDVVACASTGNAAASMAAYAATSGLSCSLFVPDPLPEAKAVQPLVYGADVHTVAGEYADAYERCRDRVTEEGWLDRSAGVTPHARAGARTLGYELAEQTGTDGLGDRQGGLPEWVVVPMGNGGTIASVWQGLKTFADLGYTERTPRLLGVQAEGASAIHDAHESSASDATESATTCADSIAVGDPHHLEEACRALTESGGTSVTVSDEAILDGVRLLGHTEGVFGEPASASVVAGIEAARDRGVLDAGDRVVAVITGTGLKDTATAMESIDQPE